MGPAGRRLQEPCIPAVFLFANRALVDKRKFYELPLNTSRQVGDVEVNIIAPLNNMLRTKKLIWHCLCNRCTKHRTTLDRRMLTRSWTRPTMYAPPSRKTGQQSHMTARFSLPISLVTTADSSMAILQDCTAETRRNIMKDVRLPTYLGSILCLDMRKAKDEVKV